MNTIAKKTIIESASLLLIYLGMQVLCGVLGLLASKIIGLDQNSVLVFGLFGSAVASIPVIYLVRVLEFKYGWLEPYDAKSYFSLTKPNYRLALLMVPATMLGVFAVDSIIAMLEVQDTLEDTFNNISTMKLGVAMISLIGPICEEYIFRGSILGGMLRRGVNTWTAIVISAFLFGLVHVNPAQVFAATFMGILFGMLYVKSKSIIPCIICHVVNNSIVVIGMLIDDEPDMSNDAIYSEIPGGITTLIILSIIAAIICCLCYRWYWKREDRE